ncbi:unnamed protein product, partial [Effrenium voratum]
MALALEGDGMQDLEHCGPAPAKKAKAQPKRRQSRGSSAGGAGAPTDASPCGEPQNDDAEDGPNKKCATCKKKKPVSDFHQQQGTCKPCWNAIRGLKRFAKAQGQEVWLKALSETEHTDLVKAYSKEHERATKERSRVKFSIAAYKEATVEQDGVRFEARRRLMTEKVFIEHAQTTEGGDLTKSQAEQKWQEMLGDPKTLKVGEGKAVKCALVVCTDIVDYSDMANRREVERQQRLSAKMTDEEFRGKANGVGQADALVLSGQSSNKRIGDAVAARVGSLSADDQGAGQIDFVPDDVRCLSAKRPRKDQNEEEDAEPHAEELVGEKGGPKSSWFDAAQQSAKASRSFEDTVQKYGQKMQQQSNAMRNQIDLSRSCNSNCKTEIMICTNRLQCLSEILVGTEKSFADYCVNLRQTASASCSVNSRGTTNESAVGHLGTPCKDHESLYTLQQFKQMASAFAKVSSEAELGALWKKVKGILGHWDELLASCKVSAQELKKADKGTPGAKATAKKGAAAKRKGKAGGGSAYQVFQCVHNVGGSSRCIADGHKLPDFHPPHHPFIFNGPRALAAACNPADPNLSDEQKSCSAAIQEFKQSFGKSDLRFVAGKAQQVCPQSCELYIRQELFGLVGVHNTHAFGQALQATHVTRTKFAALKQAMASSCYGVIKGHRSVRLETAAMATLRFGAEGRREVVVALATDIVNFLRNEEKQQRPADAEEAEPITTNAAAHW